jgi:O-antigen/teichoic acid export membrane protein
MRIDKKKVISDSIFISAGNLILKIKSLIFMPIIISSIGLSNYGAFVQIMINPSIMIPFCSLSLGMGFFRYTSQYSNDEIDNLSKDYWTVLSSSILLSIIGAATIYLASPLISDKILAGTSLKSLRLSSLLVITEILMGQNLKYIQSRKRFKLFASYNLIYSLLPYLGLVAGIIIKSDIFWGLFIYLVIQIILITILMGIIIKELKIVLPSFLVLINFLKYSWALIFANITNGLLSKIDRYFVGYFLGPSSIGIYNIVYSAVSLLYSYTDPFNKYFGIYLPQIWDSGDVKRVTNQLKEGLLYYLIISIGTLITLTFYLEPVIIMILPNNVLNIPHIELLIIITGLGILCLGSSRFFYQIINYSKMNHFQLFFQSIALIANIVLNYLLIPYYGLIGAGIATFVSYFIIVFISNYFFNMKLNFQFVMKVLKIMLAGFSILIVFKLSNIEYFHYLIISMLFSTLLYSAFIFIFRVITLKSLKQRFW